MSATLENSLEAVRKALGKSRERLVASAKTPFERLTLAVRDRDPAGFTEVLAADVVSVAASVAEHSKLSRACAAGALAAIEASAEAKREGLVVHSPTAGLTELLGLSGNPQ